ncbi:hypothetical protein [Geomonas subterranea]|uniref:hypothetical protein n=1 Tax=Geomonas subterranea TaxID=2847989 RepID=UPI001CD4C967|nr:hypothetical protein [Geomonas fuzhouensis]
MIGKILLSLLIGCLVGGAAYVVLGLLRRDGSGDSTPQKQSGALKSANKPKRKRPRDGDDDQVAGRGPDSGLAPTKEWFGGFRE